MNRQNPTPWWVWLLPLPFVWWASAGLALRWDAAAGLAGMLAAVNDLLARPFPVYYTPQTPRFLLLGTALYAGIALVLAADHKNTRPGEEHGSARWGNVFALNRKYADRAGPNLLLTRHFRIGVDGYKHKHNTNILVVGGSGAGKTRTYAVPNVLEAARAGRERLLAGHHRPEGRNFAQARPLFASAGLRGAGVRPHRLQRILLL